MKRSYLFAGLFCLALVSFLWWACSEDHPSDESLAQIELGTKLDEVIKALGNPVDQQLYKFDFVTIGISQGPGDAWYCFGVQMTPHNVLVPCLKAHTNSGGVLVGTSSQQVGGEPPESVNPDRNHFWLGQAELLWLKTDDMGTVISRHRFELQRADSPAKAWIKKHLSMDK